MSLVAAAKPHASLQLLDPVARAITDMAARPTAPVLTMKLLVDTKAQRVMYAVMDDHSVAPISTITAVTACLPRRHRHQRAAGQGRGDRLQRGYFSYYLRSSSGTLDFAEID
jgi:hypothetical protein